MIQDAIQTEEDPWAIMNAHFNPASVQKTEKKLQNPDQCEICDGNFVTSKEGLVCEGCGHCIMNVISEQPEWRNGPSTDGSAPKQSSRCGAPVTNQLFSNQLGTMVKDKYPGFRSRLSKLHLRSINSKDRCLFHAYKHFNRAQQEFGVPSAIVDRAKYIYKQISEKILTRGDKRKGIMGNCLLRALEENNVPRTTKEIAKMFKIEVKDITRMRNTFYENAGEIIKTAKAEDLTTRVILSFNFELKLRMKVLRKVGRNLEIVKKSKRLSGKTPSGIMAAVLWSVIKPLNIDLIEEDVAKASGVSTPTMVKLFHLIEDLF